MVVTIADSPDILVQADEDQIEQALINLVRNAAEAALSLDAPTDAQPAVMLDWASGAGDVVISVVDSGPGLTNAGNLFVPFYTTKPSGTGIGLVLAQQVAQAHKGSVQLANRGDGIVGCCAELRIPLNGILV